MNQYQIFYRDIPAYANEARKGKAVAVTLGSFHGTLYRYIVSREIKERSVQRGTWRQYMCDFLLMLFTLLVAKRLILLAYYHAESLQSYQAIQFERNGGDWVVWFNRVNHAAGSKVEQMELVARSVQFLSKCDEEQFFGWLDKLPCVTGYYGQGTDLLIGVQGDQLDDISLRELLGLFHRYDIDAPQLAAFETDANRVWFRDSRAYWHASVFG